jgi:hypothetical protein
LMHPFVVDRDTTHVMKGSTPQIGRELPAVQCNPGVCAAGQICSVNRCVAAGSVDATAQLSFIEQRDVNANDGDSHYGVDLLYERRQCVPAGTTPLPPTQAVCE